MRIASIRKRTAAIVAAALLVSGACGGDDPPPTVEALDHLPRGTVSVGRHRFDVWIAETPEARGRGLMEVSVMPPEAGMVFLFEEPSEGGFWMKDTLIPLSIAYWDADSRVVAILDMEPCSADPCPVYSPGTAYVAAIEVNRGALEGAGVGDRVTLTRASS